MAPRFSTYLYPWDLAQLGVTAVLDDLESFGISGVHLAANYHAISAVSGRAPGLRIFFCPRGAVFFPARAARYGRIKPLVWPDEEVTSIWHALSREMDARSLTLTIWTIAMFQPWMAQDYPFAARVTASGDRHDSGVCPNSPDVQEYLANLAVDLAEQFHVRGFALEGNGIPPYNYGWIRPRMFTRLTPAARELLRLCFCDSCTALASARGLDPEAIRARVRAELHAAISAADGPTTEDAPELDEELEAYAQLGSIGAENVVRTMADALAASGTGAGVLVAAPGTDVGGRAARYEEIAEVASGIRLFGAGSLAEQQRFLDSVRRTAPETVTEVMLHPPSVPGMPILTASYDYDDPHFRTEYADALAAGLDWIGVYHYGLLDAERFSRTMALLGVERR